MFFDSDCQYQFSTQIIAQTCTPDAANNDDILDYYSIGHQDAAYTLTCQDSDGGDSSKDALSAGAIAGIVISGVAFLALCLVGGWWCLYRGCGETEKAPLTSAASSSSSSTTTTAAQSNA